MDSPTRIGIAHDEAIDALRRVGADRVFARAPQLRRLLEYLGQRALTDGGNPKEYTIAVEALGRPDDFDSERDAIVRVQAGRLRRALEKYYAGAGRDEPIRIVLPVGSYGVIWERQAGLSADPARANRRWSPRLVIVAGIALIIIGLLVPASHMLWTSTAETMPAESILITQPTNGLPTVVIVPFDGPGAEVDGPALAGLRRRLGATFSQFETANVIQLSGATPGRPIPPPRFAEGERGYVLSAAATRQNNGLRVLFQLTDQPAGTIAWTQAMEIPAQESDLNEERIVRRLATALLQPLGIVSSRERANQLRTGTGDPRYRCLLQSMDALRDSRPQDYAAARQCLEQVVEKDPTYTLAYAYLALVLNRYYQYGVSGEPGLLDAALAAARRAVDTNPASSRAYFALFVTRFNMGDFRGAEVAMTQARALNRDDLLVLSEYGGRLVTLGRIDEGMAILDAVAYAFPARSCTHGLYMFLGNYVRGNMAEARRRASEITCENFPYAQLARALAAVDAGDKQTARAALALVRVALPTWQSSPRATLSRSVPDPSIVDRILRDLGAAGLMDAVN
jgi:tetratricopeptide (TPR) repeat protein